MRRREIITLLGGAVAWCHPACSTTRGASSCRRGDPMKRRHFIALLGGWRFVTNTQQHDKLKRIGLLIPVSEASAGANVEALRRGLRDLGYVQGLNVVLEYRYANGKDDLLPRFAAELVQAAVDVIVTWGTPAALAAKQETLKIPVVMAAIADPTGTNVVQSVSQPGSNITGVTSIAI